MVVVLSMIWLAGYFINLLTLAPLPLPRLLARQARAVINPYALQLGDLNRVEQWAVVKDY